MKNSTLIAETTKEERKEIVNTGLAISTLGAPEPDEETMELINLYIEGKMELSEALQITIERAKAKGDVRYQG